MYSDRPIFDDIRMDTVVDQVIFTIKFILVWIVDSIKAILPNGVLPKKSIVGDVVVVTGAGSGLGRLMSIEFAKLGALVALWDVNEKGNEETKKMVEQAGGKAIAYTVDLSKKASIYEVAEKTKNDFQRVDILVNNAGIVTGKKLFDCPDELMELTMAVNTNALFFTAKAFLPSMLQRNHGHLVTVASMAGKTGAAGLVDYCASKHGAVGFHESITAEIHAQGRDGVKTTCVCPYYIDTGMFDGVETFAPTLLPILQPQYVVDQIVESVLTDKEVLLLPKFSYMVLFFSAMLPSRATRLFADYLGVNNTMDHFKGRTAKKTA